MLLHTSAGFCGSLLAACSSKPSEPATGSAEKPGPSAIIPLGELTIALNGKVIARLHADGRSESMGGGAPGKDALTPGPTFNADGTIQLTKGGVVARVEADGDIFVLNPGVPEKKFARISGDQVLVEPDGANGIRLEGDTLKAFSGSDTPYSIGTVEPSSMRHTALVVAAAFFIEIAVSR